MKFKLSPFVFLSVFIPSLLFSQSLKIGAGSIYNINNDLIKSSIGYDFKLQYQAQKHIAIWASFGRTSKNLDENTKTILSQPLTYDFLSNNNDLLLGGDIQFSWIEFNPIYYLVNDSAQKFKVFCGLGIGVYFVENKWSPAIYDALLMTQEQFGLRYYENRSDKEIGYNLRVGLELPITTKSHFCFEFKYMLLNPELRYTIYDEQDLLKENNRSINLDGFSGGVSLIISI